MRIRTTSVLTSLSLGLLIANMPLAQYEIVEAPSDQYKVSDGPSGVFLLGDTNDAKTTRTGISSDKGAVTDEAAARLDTDEKRHLRAVNASEFEKRDIKSGAIIVLDGELGQPVVSENRIAANINAVELSQFLGNHKAVLGEIVVSNFEIDAVYNREGATLVRFHQVIGDLELPPSRLSIAPGGRATYLSIVTGNPADPVFDKSNWISEAEAVASAKASYEASYGEFNSKQMDEEVDYQVMFNDTATELLVVMVIGYQQFKIVVNANTGQVEFIAERFSRFSKHCDNNSSASALRSCSSPNTTLFYENRCLNNDPRCDDEEVFGANWRVFLWDLYADENDARSS